MSKIYLCSPKKFSNTLSLPTIEFNLLVNELDLDSFDTILFTSKQAILYTDRLNSSWKSKKILAVGEATKNFAKELGAKDIYHPKEYYGKVLANDILQHFKDRKIVYIRPKVISFDSKAFLKSFGIDIAEKIIYETRCKEYKNRELEKNSIIIFTSPSTIKCFFNSFSWDESFRAVVIGKSTLQNLPKNIKAYIANKPTIAACVEKAKEIANF